MDDVRVALRPAVAADFWLFERQAVDPAAGGAFNWSGFKDVGRMRRRFDENGLVGPDDGCLIVVAGEAVAGTVVWHKAVYGAPAWSCWNIGISLLPEHRGRGVGTRAQRQLASYLLDTTPVTRVEAYTDVENHAEQRALEKAGFVREGTLRSTQFREGRWRDMVIYSLLRDEARSGS